MLYEFFQNNLEIVFFVYGFAFMVMGIAILIRPREASEFKISNILWLLGFFGVCHGINELVDMWAIIKGRNHALDLIRWFILVGSYVFLFEFGRQLVRQTRSKGLYRLLAWWLTPLIGTFILASGFMSHDFWKVGSIWTRYLMGLPGGLLVGFGFYNVLSK